MKRTVREGQLGIEVRRMGVKRRDKLGIEIRQTGVKRKAMMSGEFQVAFHVQ